MADSSQYNLSLVITANNKATEELNKIWKSVDNVKWGVLQLSDSTKKTLKTVWITATAVAWSMVALWKTFVDSAMELEPLQRSFERLSSSVWVASDEMLQAMRKASRWTVSDLKLMESANTAYSLGVVKSTEDMTTLMEIARVKWQAMWRSMEEALDDIVRWLWRSSPMILDNLWITVKLWEAQEIYAKQIWKSVNALTEAEKKQALVNYVVSQWKKELEEAWELQLTMAERLQIVNTQRENMKATLWQALLPILQNLLERITPVIDKVSTRIEQNPELAVKIWVVITAVAWLVAWLSGLALILPTITTALWVLTWPIWLIIAWITALTLARTNNRWWIQEKTQVAVETIERILKPRLDRISQRRKEHGETVLVYVDEIMWALAETIWTTLWVVATYFALCFEGIKTAFDLFSAVINWDTDKITEILINRWAEVDETLTQSFGEARENIKAGILKFYDRVVDKFNALKKEVQKIANSIKNARNNASDKVSWAVSSAVNRVSAPFKAWWWVVYAWSPYIVWENGPELFIPSQRWTITPNNQITNNNWIEINISWVNVRSEDDARYLAEEIVRQIKLEKDFGIS